MMDWYGNGWMGSGLWMLLFMVLFWGGLLALGVWVVARLTHVPAATTPPETPRQILDRRFANGEIDAEQYAAARQLLEGRTATGATPTP
jgi:putative membrane protein